MNSPGLADPGVLPNLSSMVLTDFSGRPNRFCRRPDLRGSFNMKTAGIEGVGNSQIPLFSIVIPCYNYSHVVGRAIESVLSQNTESLQLVVVDDGSSDDSWQVVSDYACRYPEKLVAHRQENQGPGAARNTGIRLGIGQYLCFLDADDELTEGALAALEPQARKGDAGFLVGGHISREEDGRESFHPAPKLLVSREAAFAAYLEREIGFSNGATFFHRSVFDGLRFPEDLLQMEDIPVFALVLALYTGRTFEHPLVRIHKHRNSLRHNAGRAARTGLRVVEVLFNHPLLPESFLKYRKSFTARRALSLFRTFYLSGDRSRALYYFAVAFRARPAILFKGKNLARYLAALTGLRRGPRPSHS